MKKPELNCLYTNPPKSGKFVALYADGGGAAVFMIKGTKVIDCADSEWSIDDIKELPEHGYNAWLPLPDSYEFWIERE